MKAAAALFSHKFKAEPTGPLPGVLFAPPASRLIAQEPRTGKLLQLVTSPKHGGPSELTMTL